MMIKNYKIVNPLRNTMGSLKVEIGYKLLFYEVNEILEDINRWYLLERRELHNLFTDQVWLGLSTKQTRQLKPRRFYKCKSLTGPLCNFHILNSKQFYKISFNI